MRVPFDLDGPAFPGDLVHDRLKLSLAERRRHTVRDGFEQDGVAAIRPPLGRVDEGLVSPFVRDRSGARASGVHRVECLPPWR